jgi:hypothetical protein
VDNGVFSHLYKINPLTGATQDLGSIGQSAFAGGSDGHGTFYALTQDQPTTFYSVALPSLAPKTIGTSDFYPDGLLAVAPNGDVYVSAFNPANNDSDNLLRINPTTGVATLVGETGYSVFSGVFVGNTLYGFDNEYDILKIDLATGAGTKVATYSLPNSDLIFGAAAPPASVPEPGTYTLAAAFTAMGLIGKWIRRKQAG